MAYKIIKIGDSYNIPIKTYITESEEEVIEKMSFGDRVLIASSGSLKQKIMGADGELYDFSADLGGGGSGGSGGSAELTDTELLEILEDSDIIETVQIQIENENYRLADTDSSVLDFA